MTKINYPIVIDTNTLFAGIMNCVDFSSRLDWSCEVFK